MKKQFIYFIIFAVLINIIIVLVFAFSKGDSKPKELGSLTISDNEYENEAVRDGFDDSEELKIADEEYYSEHNMQVSFYDPDYLLSQNDFLSFQAHYLKSEKASEFLQDNGFEDAKILTVLSDSLEKTGFVSTFDCTIDDSTTVLHITYHWDTNIFDFELR